MVFTSNPKYASFEHSQIVDSKIVVFFSGNGSVTVIDVTHVVFEYSMCLVFLN